MCCNHGFAPVVAVIKGDWEAVVCACRRAFLSRV